MANLNCWSLALRHEPRYTPVEAEGGLDVYDKATCCSHRPRVYSLARSRVRPATDTAGTGLVAEAPAADTSGVPRFDLGAVGCAVVVQGRSGPLVDRVGYRILRD